MASYSYSFPFYLSLWGWLNTNPLSHDYGSNVLHRTVPESFLLPDQVLDEDFELCRHQGLGFDGIELANDVVDVGHEVTENEVILRPGLFNFDVPQADHQREDNLEYKKPISCSVGQDHLTMAL